MVMAPTIKVILGSIAFGVFWLLAVFPAIPILPIGRTAGSLLGAMLMVVFQVLTPDQAYAAIDLPILGLLFGTMVVSVYLERADMFKYLGKVLSWKSKGAKDLICRVCLISALSSALFTNDTICVILTEFVLKIARQHNLPPRPFLLALASSANIGSAATPIGNPQNLVIAIQSKIAFGEFVVGLLPAVLVGVILNAFIILVTYWNMLSIKKVDEEIVISEVIADEDVDLHQFSPCKMSHVSSFNSQEFSAQLDSTDIQNSPRSNRNNRNLETQRNSIGSNNGNAVETRRNSTSSNNGNVETLRNSISSKENEIHKSLGDTTDSVRVSDSTKECKANGSPQKGEETFPSKSLSAMEEQKDSTSSLQSLEVNEKWSTKWKRTVWKSCVYLVTIGMLIALLLGLNMSWTAMTAALALVVLDFKDAQPCLEKVSYSLLIFFCGMFITVDGFNKTGIPSAVWELMEPHAQINRVTGVIVLALVILHLSNLASNVPTVLLLGARVAASAAAISPAAEKRAWLILAWVSTVAGNLSLLGSAANLIVCEQARRAPQLGYTLSFWNHLKFGAPSTLIITAIGLVLIR